MEQMKREEQREGCVVGRRENTAQGEEGVLIEGEDHG
jgi:hypothetical protein